MHEFFEKIKDIIYDSVDYIIMALIIGVVVLVIGWRLDLLFAKDAVNMPPSIGLEDEKEEGNPDDLAILEDDPIEEDQPLDPVGQEEVEEEKEKEEEEVEEEIEEEPVNPPSNPSGKIVRIDIPDGSLPGKIGSILEEKGLVKNKDDFVKKSIELKLDTRLRSGSFEIEEGSTVEEIVKLIAKK